ncbi:MAG: acyl-CoA carboxylase subunit beta [Deltaproteobacteria bacterium]|nr:acyl-CoA carboxylase subunit beta [Deltaproteobacteria bacterium]
MEKEQLKGTQAKIQAFEARKEALMKMGGDKMITKQHELGKLTARERLDRMYDKDTFQEVQLFVKHRSTLFGLDKKEIHADGVITGFGKVNGRTVYAAAQDFTSSGGSLGEMHAKKIWKIMDMALAARKPFVAMNDSGGARIQEGVPALDGYGGIFYRNTIGSGYIPQITAIMGPTAGGAVYSPALTDWVFMVKKSSYMYITGPDVIKAVIGEEVTHDALGGAVAHATKSGVCHFATENDEDCIHKVKILLSYLPDSCHRFIRFCDAFNIPLLTFADVPGYMPGTNQEWSGIISHGAKLLHAYSEATVPKITVVTRKDYGGAYIGMCSKYLGADYVMAWPSAEIAVMGAEGACNIVYRREISSAQDPAARRGELVALYEAQFNNPYFAASMGIIEEIIAPRDTRKRVAVLLDALKDKSEVRLPKKHNNIPL